MARFFQTAAAPIYLMLCLVLGGASLAGYWANMFLQLLALPLIAWSLLVQRRSPIPTASRQLLGVAGLAVLVVAVQLIPLPPAIWTSLPGRSRIVEGLQMIGLPLPWMPISLAPHDSIASALWLLPAFAVLLAIVKLGSFKPGRIAWSILAVAAAAVVLGALQVLAGGNSQWQFYEISNLGSATGFFANSNHMATLLIVCIPFLAALYLSAVKAERSTQRASALLVVLAGVLAVILVGLAINRSLAGLGLAVPVLGATILMLAVRNGRLPWWSASIAPLLAIAAVYLIFTGPFGNNLVGEQAETQGSRKQAFSITLAAAKDFFPAGSGLGTFVPIYRTYEDPATITRVYMNHAHGDYIELFLETGILGLIVFAIFLVWWGRRTIAIWRSSVSDHFARAATIGSGAILAHSAVDYPLRTVAIAALFAACCALMAEPRVRASESKQRKVSGSGARHLSAD